MTYSDIYTKFLIEYDKQNITSSYPSLTVYEIATLLDKAYLALIAQKLTGNNPRRAPFEIDIKAIEDLRPLIKEEALIKESAQDGDPLNMIRFDIDNLNDQDYLYYVSSKIENGKYEFVDAGDNIDRLERDPVQLINHSMVDKFLYSSVNIPWIKTPVGFLEDHNFCVLVDMYSAKHLESEEYEQLHTNDYGRLFLTYIKRPKPFVGEDDNTTNFSTNPPTEFELSDTMAEELINLAIVMALETVESPRIQTKEQTRALES